MSNILFLLNSLRTGGSEKKSVNIANYLTQRGVGVHFCYLNEPQTLRSQLSDDLRVTFFDRKKRIDIGCMRRYTQYIEREGIESVCCIGPYPLFFHRMALSFLKHKPKVALGLNVSVSVNMKSDLSMRFFLRFVGRDCKVIFGSHRQRDYYLNRYGLDALNTCVIHNGVNLSHFSPDAVPASREELLESFGVDPSSVALGTIAQFRPEKAHRDLLTMMGRLKGRHNVTVLMAGDGPELPGVRQYAKECGLNGSAHFLGHLFDVRPVLKAIDILVIPSVAVETFSNAALEAMAFSKPVVLSNIGGAQEMVRSGLNGYIFEPGRVDELTAAIEKMIAGRTFLEMGRYARKVVESEFAFETMAEEYRNILSP